MLSCSYIGFSDPRSVYQLSGCRLIFSFSAYNGTHLHSATVLYYSQQKTGVECHKELPVAPDIKYPNVFPQLLSGIRWYFSAIGTDTVPNILPRYRKKQASHNPPTSLFKISAIIFSRYLSHESGGIIFFNRS